MVTTAEITLKGLDCANMPDYMAAVGVLRVLDRQIKNGERRPTVRWRPEDHGHPTMEVDGIANGKDAKTVLVDRIFVGLTETVQVLAGIERKGSKGVRNLPPYAHQLTDADQDPASTYYEGALRRADTEGLRWLAGLGTLAVPDGEKRRYVTALDVLRGTSHQSIIEVICGISEKLANGASHHKQRLSDALFAQWSYDDDAESKPRDTESKSRDTESKSRYNLRWSSAEVQDPSQSASEPKTNHLINRLAVEALAMYPVHGVRGRAVTRGVVRLREGATRFRWALWSEPMDWDALHLLVGHPDLVASRPDVHVLAQLGVWAVYEAERREMPLQGTKKQLYFQTSSAMWIAKT